VITFFGKDNVMYLQQAARERAGRCKSLWNVSSSALLSLLNPLRTTLATKAKEGATIEPHSAQAPSSTSEPRTLSLADLEIILLHDVNDRKIRVTGEDLARVLAFVQQIRARNTDTTDLNLDYFLHPAAIGRALWGLADILDGFVGSGEELTEDAVCTLQDTVSELAARAEAPDRSDEVLHFARVLVKAPAQAQAQDEPKPAQAA